MIAVDTNILVYAHRAETTQHEVARRRLVALAEGAAPWAIPVLCLSEFLRVVTHAAVFDPPTPMPRAVEAVDALLASPSNRVLFPGPRWWPLFRAQLEEGRVTGNLVLDAAIAALCVEHGVRALLTEDRDFARFEAIRVDRLDD